ncbi:hypothetical protein P5G50_07270 [Leifsonia sp. F6_8S_P_1B]|uniref:Uncharacterized protein n=1 Tax=Leifsonia williamsii TaxID=3035919 RepID=A0ABT8KD55_9MICO|nr:hypothetical protein [Leifsonia williamsii]MDN4614249.1 hypothetical protein [Leifsonia williamsii]
MTTYDTPIGNAPKPGQDIHLVRWIRSADGWSSETVLCTYLGGTPHEWIVESAGERTALSRDEWAQFAF